MKFFNMKWLKPKFEEIQRLSAKKILETEVYKTNKYLKQI